MYVSFSVPLQHVRNKFISILNVNKLFSITINVFIVYYCVIVCYASVKLERTVSAKKSLCWEWHPEVPLTSLQNI